MALFAAVSAQTPTRKAASAAERKSVRRFICISFDTFWASLSTYEASGGYEAKPMGGKEVYSGKEVYRGGGFASFVG